MDCFCHVLSFYSHSNLLEPQQIIMQGGPKYEYRNEPEYYSLILDSKSFFTIDKACKAT